jgi:hypothetical protein
VGCVFSKKLIKVTGGASAVLSPQDCGRNIMTRRNYELNKIDEQSRKDYSNAELKKTFYTLAYPKNCPTNGGKLPSLPCED